MKAIVKRSKTPEDVALLDIPEPQPAAGQVLVRTEACGVCGSDVHAWKQDQGYDWVNIAFNVADASIVGRSFRPTSLTSVDVSDTSNRSRTFDVLPARSRTVTVTMTNEPVASV